MVKNIQKMNKYFVKKPNRIFAFLLSTIVGLSFLSIFFLFMTVSYKYSITEKTKILDMLIVQNSIKEAEVFNQENMKYNEEINKTLVFADNIIYLRSNENLAMNISR